MYHLQANIQLSKIEELRPVLNYMLGQASEMPSELPSHELFKQPGWSLLLEWEEPEDGTFSKLDDFSNELILSTLCLIKLGTCLFALLDWLQPYMLNSPGTCFGSLTNTSTNKVIYLYS